MCSPSGSTTDRCGGVALLLLLRGLLLLELCGKRETLLEGFALTTPLYRTEETKGRPPFQVTDADMASTVDLLVEYGGLDAAAKGDAKSYYTRDYLPAAGN